MVKDGPEMKSCMHVISINLTPVKFEYVAIYSVFKSIQRVCHFGSVSVHLTVFVSQFDCLFIRLNPCRLLGDPATFKRLVKIVNLTRLQYRGLRRRGKFVSRIFVDLSVSFRRE